MSAGLDDRSLAALRRAVTELASQSGRGVPRDAIVELAGAVDGYALSIYGGEPPLAVARPRTPPVFAPLSARERQVAALLARGCGNGEIAAELVISEATVKDHVHSILRKTGLKTRAAVAGRWRD